MEENSNNICSKDNKTKNNGIVRALKYEYSDDLSKSYFECLP